MPRQYRSKRRLYKRRKLAKVARYNSYGGVRRVAIGRRHKRGFAVISRKLPILNISSSGTGGTVFLSDPTASCLNVGTPSLSQGFTSGVYDIPFSMSFQLDQDTQSGDITSLADQYKIVGAYVRLFYNQTLYNATVASPTMPQVIHITDHDDASIPSVAGIRAHMGLKYKTFTNESSYIGMMVRPVPSNELYTSTAVAYGVPGRAPWINSSTAKVPHYGIKGVLLNVPLPAITDAQSVFNFDVTLRVLAKDFQ